MKAFRFAISVVLWVGGSYSQVSPRSVQMKPLTDGVIPDSWSSTGCSASQGAQKTLTIGGIAPLSTDAGEQMREAWEYFFSWLNAERGGVCVGSERHLVDLLVVDEDGDGGVQYAVEKLLDNNINFLLGPSSANLIREVEDLIENDGKAVIVVPMALPVPRNMGRSVGVVPPLENQLRGLFQGLAGKISTVSVLNNPSGGSGSVCDTVKDHLGRHGISFSGYVSSVADLMDPLPDLLVICGSNCINTLESMRESNFNVPALALFECAEATSLEDVGDNARFVITTSLWRDEYSSVQSNANFGSDPNSLASALSQIEGGHFSANYASIWGNHPTARAVNAWAAANVLVQAIENTTPGDDVMESLGKFDADTIIGRIRFDSQGQRFHGYDIVQLQDKTAVPVNGISFVFPMPLWSDRQCYKKEDGIRGFRDGKCVDCLSEYPAWDQLTSTYLCQVCHSPRVVVSIMEDLKLSQILCRACDVGKDLDGHSCPKGTRAEGCQCKLCPAGRAAAAVGSSECTVCPGGTAANQVGSMACDTCDAGTYSVEDSPKCSTCASGWFSELSGSTRCNLCQVGRASENPASTSCETCPVGSESVYGHTKCSLCPVGKYGRRGISGIASCFDGSSGGYFTTAGQTGASNLPRHWLRDDGETLPTWEYCQSYPHSCIEGEKCAEGSTGVHCTACLPGWASNSRAGAACFKCPGFEQNIACSVTALVLNAMLVMWVGTLASGSANRQGLDLRLVMFKLFMLQSFVGSAQFRYLEEIVEEWGSFLPPGMRRLAHTICTLFSFIPAFSLYAESPIWSISCLAQGSLGDASQGSPDLWNLLQESSHSDWFSPTLAFARSELKQFHLSVEKRSTIFWLCWPWAILLLSVVVSAVIVSVDLARNKENYKLASLFHEEVLMNFPKQAVANCKMSELVEVAFSRRTTVLGLWRPAWFVNAEGFRDVFSIVSAFSLGVESMPLCVFLLTYGGVLTGLSRLMLCRQISGIEKLTKAATTISCGESSFETNFATAAFCIWGFGVPLLTTVFISLAERKGSEQAHGGTTVLWTGALTLGYRRSAHHWEVCVFLFRLLIVACHFPAERHTRLLFITVATCWFGVWTELYSPFVKTGFSLPPRLMLRLTVLLVMSTYGLLVAEENFFGDGAFWAIAEKNPETSQKSEEDELNVTFAMFVLLFMIAGMHTALTLNLFKHFISQTLDATVAGFCKANAFQKTSRSRPQRLLMYLHEIDHRGRPYVSFEPELGWITVCGSRADAAIPVRALPDLPPESLDNAVGRVRASSTRKSRKSGRKSRGGVSTATRGGPDFERHIPSLSTAPTLPVKCDRVNPSTLQQRMSVQDSLLHVVSHLATLPGNPVFSMSVFEFAVRATIVLALEIEEEEHVLTREFVSKMGNYTKEENENPAGDAVPLGHIAQKAYRASKESLPAEETDDTAVAAEETHDTAVAAEETDDAAERPNAPIATLQDTPEIIPDLPDDEDMGLAFTVSLSLGATMKTRTSVAETREDKVALLSKCFLGSLEQRELRMQWTKDSDSKQRHIAPHHASGVWREAKALGKWFAARFNSKRSTGAGAEDPIRRGGSQEFSQVGSRAQVETTAEGITSGRPEQVRCRLDAMFRKENFTYGVELLFFQEAALRLQELPTFELRSWLDHFEKEWNKHNKVVMHTVQSIVGAIENVSTWVQPNPMGYPEDPRYAMCHSALDDDSDFSDADVNIQAHVNWVRLYTLYVHAPAGDADTDAPAIGQISSMLKHRHAAVVTAAQQRLQELEQKIAYISSECRVISGEWGPASQRPHEA